MTYIIGVIIGGVLIAAIYELLVLPLLVGKPRALWGRWPVEAQSDVYERGYQAAMAKAVSTAISMWASFDKPSRHGLDDHGLRCKAAAMQELSLKLMDLVSGEAKAKLMSRLSGNLGPDDDLTRGVAGAVGPDTTGPRDAMRRDIYDIR